MSVTIMVGTQSVVGGHLPSLTIQDVFAPTGDLCDLDYTFIPGQTILPEVSQLLQIVFADDQGTNETVFLGPITEVEVQSVSPGGYRASISAVDLTVWMDSKLVAGIFTQSTVTTMVAAILAAHAPNFDRTTYIDAADTTNILPKSFDWKKVSECLQEIAEEKGYVWWVDFAGAVHFVPKAGSTTVAPLAAIVPTTNTVVGDFRFTVSRDEPKNTIFVKDFFFRSPNLSFEPGEDGFVGGNGITLQATAQPPIELGFEPYDLTEMVFEVNNGGAGWNTYTVRREFVEGTVGDATTRLAGSVYIDAKGRKGRVYHSSGVDTAFAASSLWRAQYRPLLEPGIPEISLNVHSIQEMAKRETGSVTNDGEYQYMMSFGSLEFGGTDPIQTLVDYIGALINDYAWPLITGSFTVYYDGARNVGVYGWKAGQWFTLLDTQLNLFDWSQYYLTGVKQPATCYIHSVRTTVINPQALKYDITFSSRLRT